MSRDKDYDREYDDRPRRLPRLEIRYTFAVNGGPAPDKVHGDRFRIGTTVSTSNGPHRVVEVYWLTEEHARVLLRRIPAEKKKAEKKPEKPAARPKKRFSKRPR